MPTIYEYFGFVFKFYSLEHEPIHVHAEKAGRQTVFDIIIENGKVVEVRERKGKSPQLTDREKNEAREFVEKYAMNIIEKWINFFVLKKSVRRTVIKKKL
ncbi:MAG: DUF4160 domain-containing protein [Bacteroidales bacterium]|nr:DUF4160 domain-containing protein [Bacteroidales bacterium]